MSYVVESISSAGTGSGALAISIGSPVVNDLILIFAAGSGASLTTPSGYTLLYSTLNTVRQYCWYKIAGASEANPTTTPGFSTNAMFVTAIVRDADTTTPITNTSGVGFNTATFTNVKEVAAPTLTTGVGKTQNLILHAGSIGTDKLVADFASAGAVCLSENSGRLFVAKEWVENASTASTAFTWLTNQSTSRNGCLGVVAINNKSGGLRDISCSMSHKRLAKPYPYGTNDTLSAPNTVLSTLDSLTVASAAAAASGSGTLSASYLTSLNIATATSFGADTWAGFAWPVSANMSGKVVGFAWNPTQPWSSVTTHGDGVAIVFSDGTKWATYPVRALSGAYLNTDMIDFISPGVSTPLATSETPSTIDWTAITTMAWMYARKGSQTNAPVVNLASAYLFDGMSTLVGGNAAKPINGNQIYKHLTQYIDATGTVGLYPFAAFQGSGQYLAYAPVQLGNGATPTYVKMSANSFETPPITTRLNDYRVADGAFGITLYGSASDTFDFSPAVLSAATRQYFTIHASSSIPAAYNFAGCSLIGYDVTWKTGVACRLVTFSGCYVIDGKAQKFDADTFANSRLTSGAYLRLDGGGSGTESGAINSSFTKGGETYAVELRTAGYYDFTDTTFSGYTNELHISAASGTVTITLATGQTQPDVYNPNGCTIVWDVPTVDIEVAPLIAGSQVVFYAQGTTTEKFRTDSSGTSATWSGASGAYDYTVQKAGYLPVRGSGAAPTASLTIDPQQKVDRAYVASSGLTININCTANTGTLKFGLTTASTLQNFYSYMIEQWISNSALRNIDFPMVPNGPNSFRFIDWTWDGQTSINYLSRDGMQYYSGGATTDVWAAILSVGVPAGFQVRYQQQDGTGTANALTTGNIDQLIKIKKTGAGAFDYTGWLVLKVQEEGYDQAEAVAQDIYGTLEDQLYVFGLTPIPNGIAAQAGITGVTIYSEPTPVSWNGQLFSTTITDTTDTHSGLQIMQYVRSLNNFNLHDMIRANGAKFKTVTGNVYGDTLTTPAGVRVVKADGTTPHPDFDLFIADSGGSYVPDVVAPITWAGAEDGTTVLLYNDTVDPTTPIAAAQAVNTSGGYEWSISLPHADVAAGDSLRLRYGHKEYYAGELQGTMTATGLAFVGSMTLHPVYAGWGLDGALYDQAAIPPGPFTMDGTHLQVDIAAGTTSGTKKALGAWTQHLMTLPAGLDAFYGAWDLLEQNQIRQNVGVVDVLIDVPTAGALFEFTDNDVNYYRSDFTYPGNIEAGHGLIAITYNAKPFVAIVTTASAVIEGTPETVAAAVRSELALELGRVDVGISTRLADADFTTAMDAVPTAPENAAAARSELSIELAAVLRSMKLLGNKKIVDPDTGLMTVYDDDDLAVLASAAAYLDAAGTQPYDGSGPVHRTERLA